jgi:toxin ParE1/3/4
MGVISLPDAQQDLLSLQEYMLDKRSEADWLKAENEIFDKLDLLHTGFLTGAPIQALADVGILEYQSVFTSHHRLDYRRISGEVYVYAIAGHRQDYPTLLMKRLLKP